MKLIDPTLKLITLQKERIDILYQCPSSTVKYTFNFKEFYKCLKLSRAYIFHKIESTIPIFLLKYGNR